MHFWFLLGSEMFVFDHIVETLQIFFQVRLCFSTIHTYALIMIRLMLFNTLKVHIAEL